MGEEIAPEEDSGIHSDFDTDSAPKEVKPRVD
jgi:hypothetical protein